MVPARGERPCSAMAVVKLAYFFIERAAEPLSARLESYAARSERFRSACGGLANWYNTIEYRKAERHRARNVGTTTAADGWEGLEAEPPLPPPPQLSEQEATTLGCELLGECFVGGVALSILLAEVATGKAEEAEQLAVIEALQSSMEEQRQQLADLQGMVQRNHELEVEATCRSGRTPIVSAEAASDAPPTWRRWLR